MNTYIFTLLVASVAAATVQLLTPKGEGGKMAESIRMIAGLFLLVALLHPLQAGMELLRSAVRGDLVEQLTVSVPEDIQGDYEAVWGDTLTFVGREEVKAWVVSVLESEFGIPPSGCRVSVTCGIEGETLTVTEVRIALGESYIAHNPHPIESYVTQKLNCPCFVTVGFEGLSLHAPLPIR